MVGANQSVLVARFSVNAIIGRAVLVGAESQRVGGSLRREDSYLEACVGNNTACRRIALSRRL